MPKELPFRLTDYLARFDWTGRLIRDGKRGAIAPDLPAILERFAIEPQQSHSLTTRFESRFKQRVSGVKALRNACRVLNRQWVHGIGSSRALLESA